MGRRFCVRCGREEEPGNPIINGLCPKCFVKERSIINLPNTVKVTVCPVCGSVYCRGTWLRLGEDAKKILEYIINNYYLTSGRNAVYEGFTDVHVKVVNIDDGRAYLIVEGTYKGGKVSHECSIDVKFEKKLCPRCVSIRGRHFEAIIQIRSEAPMRREIIDRLTTALSRIRGLGEYVVEVKEYKEGLDIKLISQSVARHLASVLKREFAAKITQTWKNSGYISGRKHSKLTISVRLPGLVRGDIVDVGDELAVVINIGQGRVVLKKLSDGSILRLNHSAFWEKGVKLLTSKDYAVMNAIVLGYEGGKAVVQGEESGNLHYITAPKLFKPGSRVKVLIYKGRTYLMI